MLKRDEIFSAPPIEEAFPPKESTLRALLERDGDSFLLRFSLGNLFLREGRYAEAAEELRRAIELNGPGVELYTNLGVALYLDRRYEEALKALRQAILQQGAAESSSVLPFLFAARAQFAIGDLDGAVQNIERVLRIDARFIDGYVLQSQIADRRGDESAALEAFERIYELNPEHPGIRAELAWRAYAQGEQLFLAGDREEAYRVWHAAHVRFYPAFLVEQRIVLGLGKLGRDSARREELRAELASLRAAIATSSPSRSAASYRVMTSFLMTMGLLPECFEAVDQLDGESLRWRQSLEEQGEHPYPHFRLGLLALYRGELTAAEKELRHCQDRLPPKKQLSLKLAELLKFHEELAELERAALEEARGRSPDWEWDEAGFDNRFEREAWRRANFRAPEAAVWRDRGFSATQARSWRTERLTPEQARAWHDSGFGDPKTARRWARGGFSPEDARQWEPLFAHRIEEGVQCRSVGIPDPETASAWLRVCRFPWDAAQWRELGFTPEGAAKWIELGIADPYRARERANDANSSAGNPAGAAHSSSSASGSAAGRAAGESAGAAATGSVPAAAEGAAATSGASKTDRS